MADHSKPLLTSTYTNFLAELDGRLDDLALGLNPSHVTATNVPTNSVRWNGSSSKWEKYNGTAWADLASLYAIAISGNAATVTNGLYSTGSYADPAWLTSLSGSKISGAIAGNAATATKLATARAINGVNFDGSAAISVNTNNAVTFNNGGAGAASGTTFNGGTAQTISYNTVGAPSTTGTNASGTWGINITGLAAGLSATLPVSKGGTGLTAVGTSGYVVVSNGAGFAFAPNSAAKGGGSDAVFYENDTTVTTDYTITTGKNAVTAGPITINTGIAVTVPDDSSWSIV